jgi:hypothetical protein
MTMTLDQLDQLLGEWKRRLDVAAQIVYDLHNLPAYEMLLGSGKQLKLTGITGAQYAPAISALESAIQNYGLLSDLIGRAEDLRKNMPRLLGAGDRIDEIARLLDAPSLPNGSRPIPALKEMSEAFHNGQAALGAIDAAWKRLDAKQKNLKAWLSAHTGEMAPAVSALRAKLDAFKTRTFSDPLGSETEFDSNIQPLFDQIRIAVEALENRRRSVHEAMARAGDMFEHLQRVRMENEATMHEYKAKVSECPPPTPPTPEERIRPLGETLAQLKAKLCDGSIDVVCAGIENWLRTASDLFTMEQRALETNQGPLNMRRELRGRMSAMKAKASARGISEDAKLARLAAHAAELLYAQPTPMRQATEAVSQYEANLRNLDRVTH